MSSSDLSVWNLPSDIIYHHLPGFIPLKTLVSLSLASKKFSKEKFLDTVNAITVHSAEVTTDEAFAHLVRTTCCAQVFPLLKNIKSIKVLNSWRATHPRSPDVFRAILTRLPNVDRLEHLTEKSFTLLLKWDRSISPLQAAAKLPNLRTLVFAWDTVPDAEFVELASLLPKLDYCVMSGFIRQSSTPPNRWPLRYVDSMPQGVGALVPKVFTRFNETQKIFGIPTVHRTLLHEACANWPPSVIDSVISECGFKNIDINSDIGYNASPLHAAVCLGSFEAVAHLVTEYHADISHLFHYGHHKMNSLQLAAASHRIYILEWLFKHCDPGLLDSSGIYKLFYYCNLDERTYDQTFTLLLDFVAQKLGIDLRDIRCKRTGRSLIFTANGVGTLQRFMDLGFSLTETDYFGGTLFQRAALHRATFPELAETKPTATIVSELKFLIDAGYPLPEGNTQDMKALAGVVARGVGIPQWILDIIRHKATRDDVAYQPRLMVGLLQEPTFTAEDIKHFVADLGLNFSMGMPFDQFWLRICQFSVPDDLPYAWDQVVLKLTEAFKARFDVLASAGDSYVMKMDSFAILLKKLLSTKTDDPRRQLLENLVWQIAQFLERNKMVRPVLLAEKTVSFSPSAFNTDVLKDIHACMTRTISESADLAAYAEAYIDADVFTRLFQEPAQNQFQRSRNNLTGLGALLKSASGAHAQFATKRPQADYCSAACQRSDWPKHKLVCNKIQSKSPAVTAKPITITPISGETQILLRRTPRYSSQPQLPHEDALRLAKAQLELQRERSQILELSYHKEMADPAPPLDSLVALDAYQATMTLPSGKKYEADSKFDGYETPNHSKGKHRTACSSAQNLTYTLTDIRFREGGLHYLVAEDRLFWGIILCWLGLGTTFPYGPCHCEEKDKSWIGKLQKEWNAKLAEVKSNPNNVQCMFWDAPIGCLNAACPFKHSTR